jgi:hypothetical protein
MINTELVKRMIEHVGEDIAPNGDWMPTLILEKDGKCTILGVPLPMDNEIHRGFVAAVITSEIRTAKADTAVWITTAWTVRLANASDAEKRDAMRLAEQHKLYQHHKRIECVVAMIGRRGVSGCEALIGEIVRRPHLHPSVEWTQHLPSGDGYAGRFPEALMEGFK